MLRQWRVKIEVLVVLLFFLIYVWLLFKTSWLSDDSYITFRTIDNWLEGYGLRWNVVERVQSYTHPLWMLLVSASYVITREFFYTVQILSIGISIIAVLLLLRSTQSYRSAIIPLVFLLSSKAFIDYSTSGLENPLTYLLWILFFILFQKRPSVKHLFFLSLFSSLAILNRMDLLLFFGPSLLFYSGRLIYADAISEKNIRLRTRLIIKRLSVIAVGFVPFIAWEIFSLLYYGFLFPNTAYAKLNVHIPHGELLIHGILYVVDAVLRDPITIVGIVSISLFVLVKKREYWHFIIGVALYFFYVLSIGGDFMSGRFFALSIFALAAMLAQIEWKKGLMVASVAYILIVGHLFLTPQPSILTSSEYLNRHQQFDISDERGFYHYATNLFVKSPDGILPNYSWYRDGLAERAHPSRTVHVALSVGYFSFAAGPRIHVVDLFALNDSLLARMPRLPGWWRIGHVRRILPTGYIATLESGENQIADPDIAQFYTILQQITRGPLWSKERFMHIWKMNRGGYDHLIQ